MQVTTDENVAQNNDSGLPVAEIVVAAVSKTPQELADIISEFAALDVWVEKVRLRSDQRWYERLYVGSDHDIWVISWLPGQSTGFHDHGASSGALIVASGILEEHRPGERARVIHPGKPLTFGADYAHDVRNVSIAPAVSIHAYSPPLTDMNEYELDGGRLVPRDAASAKIETVEETSLAQRADALSIEQMLAAARARLRRLSPDEAHAAMVERGAILVDIRPEAQRAIEGGVAGAQIVERNVLEWRFDPTSSARLPVATDHDIEVIVFCSEGYTSSLAAVALKELGLWRATDVIGGFQAWRNRCLPVVPVI
jgi:rhodanese-related sulfurtransferase/mannose-6-phosphate isomerase-like protein (cupin superfamily)